MVLCRFVSKILNEVKYKFALFSIIDLFLYNTQEAYYATNAMLCKVINK